MESQHNSNEQSDNNMPVDPLSHEYNSNQNIISPIFAFPGHLSKSITPEYSQKGKPWVVIAFGGINATNRGDLTQGR